MRELLFGTFAGEPDLTDDDRRLVAPMRQLGFEVRPLQWDRDPIPPQAAGLVFRSCWNYDRKPGGFRGWLTALESRGLRCCNSPSLVRWNLHKRYLLELGAGGARIPPTLLIARDDRPIADRFAALGTREAVVKPAISMLANDTYRLSADRPEEAAELLARVCRRGEVLLQAFVPEIQTQGETSLVFFDGIYSHAVRKLPAPGDFRSQTDHGGTRTAASPSAAIQAQAAKVLAQLPERPAIARVDGVEVAGQLVLMELELIDPSVFFATRPDAVARCAQALAAWFA